MSEDTAERRWDDHLIGDRMEVDQKFQSHVENAGLSNQSWELIMRAVQFEIVHDQANDEYTIQTQFDRLDSVLPAVAGAQKWEGELTRQEPEQSSGLFSKLNELLGRSKSGEDYREQAEDLATAYAEELQEHLVERDKWDEIVAEEFPEHE